MAKRSTALCYKAMTYNGRDVHQCFSENTQIHTSAANLPVVGLTQHTCFI